MRTYRFVALGAALLLILAPADAWAVDGTITGLTADNNPADVNQDVVITVLGTQKCKKVSVDFGDNSTPEILNNPDFENNDVAEESVTHAYTSDGNYTVVASPLQQCSGGAQLSLTVGSGGGDGGGGTDDNIPAKWKGKDPLCGMLANCPSEASLRPSTLQVQLPPHIEGMFTLSVIEPGGALIVYGERFGSTKGELHVYLKTDKKDIKLTVETWGPGGIGAKIPYSTYGVVDQPAEFYVKTAGGVESNRRGPVNFTARRGLKVLPRSDVHVDGCGTDSDCDLCLGWFDSDDAGCFTFLPAGGSLAGMHSTMGWEIGNDNGQDTYKPKTPLKNGWQLDQAIIINHVDPGEGLASASLTSSQIKVDWWVSPGDSLGYAVYVMIKGPIGISHK